MMTKKIASLSIVLFIGLSLFAQKKYYYNEDGDRVKSNEAVYYRTVDKGKSKFRIKEYYASNNQLKSKGSYLGSSGDDEERSGRFEYYYENGQLHYKARFKDGLIVDEYIEYHKDGKVKAKGVFAGGKETGEWVYYYKNGQIQAKGYFFAGKYNADWEWFYKDGTIRKKARYKNGIKDGNYTTYFKNGKTHKKAYYDMDSFFGKYTEFWDNGNLAAEGIYYNNKKDSTWMWYHKNGNRSCRVLFERGEFNNGDYYKEDGTESDKRVRERNLVRLPKYPGGIEKMNQLVLNRLKSEEFDLKGARRAKYKTTAFFEVEINEQGEIGEVTMLKPDENKPYSDPFNVIEAFKASINDLPDLTPMLAYNRNTSTTVYFTLKFSAPDNNLRILAINMDD